MYHFILLTGACKNNQINIVNEYETLMVLTVLIVLRNLFIIIMFCFILKTWHRKIFSTVVMLITYEKTIHTI